MASEDRSAVSLRLPATLHGAARSLARSRGVSVNALITESLEKVLREEEEKAFFDSYTLLGQDADANDVEYALPAQGEVMLRDEEQG